MKLALSYDDLFLEHLAPPGHPERQARLVAARAGLAASAFADDTLVVPARDATDEELCRVHSPEHVARMRAHAGFSGYIDGDTFHSPRSFDAAVRASGGAVSLVSSLLSGECDYALALCRPPGHHATRDRAMGFCMFNHIAVAAAHALTTGSERVLILDFDVHHGNGTEDIFYDSQKVLYASVHQSPQYPGTGLVSDVGSGAGRGFTVNVPLAAGAGDAAYVECFERVFCPILRQYDPELLLVSAGYDAHADDPLGGMAISSDGYGELTHLLLDAMPSRGRGRVLFLLEGGYDLGGITGGVSATLSAAAAGARARNERSRAKPRADISATHRRQIDQAITVQSEFWKL
ncbi:MAG: hypothetical protein RJA70_128 [Pseudomonadota bacterium]